MPPPSHIVENLRAQHAQQLSSFAKASTPPDTPGEIPTPPTEEDLLKWIETNKKAIDNARESRTICKRDYEYAEFLTSTFYPGCSSADPGNPNWNVVLFALMECSAIGLR